MACVENIPPKNADSEMEEGEIVDELDDLSDISSEEEFLLRQRLQVLENYNHVLERKKAKRSSIGSGKQRLDIFNDLSEISATDLDDTLPRVKCKESLTVYRNVKDHRHFKSHHKPKKRKDVDLHRDVGRNKDYKKKPQRKKRLEVKVISESSDDSDDEYRNKRRKLANAVIVHRDKNDKSSLHARLQKMLCTTKTPEPKPVHIIDRETETDTNSKLEIANCSPIVPANDNVPKLSTEIEDIKSPNVIDNHINVDIKSPDVIDDNKNIDIKSPDVIEDNGNIDVVDLCTDDDVVIVTNEQAHEAIDFVNKKQVEYIKKDNDKDSDEDLEMLRQHALNTKASKAKVDQPIASVENEPENKPLILSEDEDSDTAELRLICLKSALLKKAIEMKRKQKLQKRLSQSSSLQDELLNDQQDLINKIDTENNNTDIESVDMDIGSDGDEKGKDISNECFKNDIDQKENTHIKHIKNISGTNVPKEEELEEDEDLLRARLLTSLSKNLPNLVDPNILNSIEADNVTDNPGLTIKNSTSVPADKRIVINVGGSDSEGEHEATKNLTKMHVKLSEQLDFQHKLDIFLKSTRMEVEKTKVPDEQIPLLIKPPQKFVAKVVNHLPKSEQIEYKNLVKRMAELEKIKQARQSSMDFMNKSQVKETLKPRNASVDPTKFNTINNLEEQIALSRKTIADESAKILKLKEEATKLSQKYKIVATELRNITTAITLNKKEQKSVHNRLCKIRVRHQRLLNSTTSKNSNMNGQFSTNWSNKQLSTTKLQKENDPSKEEYKNLTALKSFKVSVVNDLNDKTAVSHRLSVQLDVSSNKKSIKVSADRMVGIERDCSKTDTSNEEFLKGGDCSLPVIENGGGNRLGTEETIICNHKLERKKEFDDYESPLQALDTATCIHRQSRKSACACYDSEFPRITRGWEYAYRHRGRAVWEGDPNAILCPFEVGGHCKDADCKYLHPKLPTQ